MMHETESNKIFVNELCFLTFLTQNFDPGHFLSFRSSGETCLMCLNDLYYSNEISVICLGM